MPPKQPTTAPDPTETIANILLREAAGDGPEGMAMVLDSMVNRSRSRKLPLDKIATQSALNKKGVRVFQYTGAADPKVADFAARQPLALQNLARELVKEAQLPDYQPSHPNENYVTYDLWNQFVDDPDSFAADHWFHNVEPAGTVRSHVMLKDKRKKKK